MASEKITITKKELNSLIMEEAKKFKKALSLKKELASINKQINEVHPGGEMAPGDSGVHAGQRKAVFATKGNPNLRMEDGVEAELGAEEGVPEMSEIERICMDLGKALEAKINAIGGGEEAGAEGGEELEFDANDLGDEADATADADAGAEGAEEEVDEVAAKVQGSDGENTKAPYSEKSEAKKPEEECMMETTPAAPVKEGEEATVAENLEEPMEGKTPAQDAKQDTVNDNMEKSKLVAEAVDPKATLLSEEKKRMAVLAGIIKG
jgi:hypothetical protein